MAKRGTSMVRHGGKNSKWLAKILDIFMAVAFFVSVSMMWISIFSPPTNLFRIGFFFVVTMVLMIINSCGYSDSPFCSLFSRLYNEKHSKRMMAVSNILNDCCKCWPAALDKAEQEQAKNHWT